MPNGGNIVGKAPVGRVLIDEGSLEEVGEMVVRDRKHISEDGILVTIIAINKNTGAIEIAPELVLRGVEFVDSEKTAGGRQAAGHRHGERVIGGRARGLHGDQGKDPEGSEEVHAQADVEAAVYSADNRGNVGENVKIRKCTIPEISNPKFKNERSDGNWPVGSFIFKLRIGNFGIVRLSNFPFSPHDLWLSSLEAYGSNSSHHTRRRTRHHGVSPDLQHGASHSRPLAHGLAGSRRSHSMSRCIWAPLSRCSCTSANEWLGLLTSGIGWLRGDRTDPTGRLAIYIVLATIPGAVPGALFQHQIETTLRSPLDYLDHADHTRASPGLCRTHRPASHGPRPHHARATASPSDLRRLLPWFPAFPAPASPSRPAFSAA